MKNKSSKLVCGIILLMAASVNPAIAADDIQTGTTALKTEIDILSQISNRRLMVDKVGGYVGEKITLKIETYSPELPMATDSVITWSISDAANKQVFTQQGGFSLEWTPDKAGTFTASFVAIQGELEVKISQSLYVLDEITAAVDLVARFWNMDEKMLGTWIGKMIDSYSEENISVVFKDNGSLQVERYNPMGMSYPMPYPPYFHGSMLPPMPPPMPSFFPGQTSGGIYSELGKFELLDIWANGEGEGIFNLNSYPPANFSNLRRVRFSDDFSMLFFEVTRDYYSMPQVYVLSRAENLQPINDVATLKSSLIGEWQGQVYAPWTEPYDVSFNFTATHVTAKGLTFSRKANSVEMTQRGAYYFGAIEQIAQPFEISTLTEGLGQGKVNIALDKGGAVSGSLANIQMSLDRSMLVFTFMHYGKYGPMQYFLKRQ